MYSPETRPPTRITDLLNPVGGPVSVPPLPPAPIERSHGNVLPSFAAIERAATGPRPPDYSLSTAVHSSATRPPADEAPPALPCYEGPSPRGSSDRQQHAQFSLRAASWDSSNKASASMDSHYGNGHPAVPSLQTRQTGDGFHPSAPANGGHAIPPHAGKAYETRQGTSSTLPSMAWMHLNPSAQPAAHAQYGRGHNINAVLGPAPHELSSQSVRQQTSLPPVPAMLGPHSHHPHPHPHPQTPTRSVLPPLVVDPVGGARATVSNGGGVAEDAMGRIVEQSPYQASERASVRLAARGTATQEQMPVPAPSGPYMAPPYLIPIVVPFPPPALTQAHISHPQPYYHLRTPVQIPQDHVDRKRPYNAVGAGDSATTIPSRPPSSTSAANSGSSTDDQPKPKRSRTKSKAAGVSPSAPEKNGKRTNPLKKRNEDSADAGANDRPTASSSHPLNAGKGKDKADSRAVGQMQAMDTHAALPFGYVGYGVGIMPAGQLANNALTMQSYQLPMILSMVPGTKPTPELQYARCMSNRYKTDAFPRCVSCTRRWAGDTCRFQGIRILLRDEKKCLVAVSFMESTKSDASKMILPDTWNIDLEERHVKRTMTTVARALLPHLKKEQLHIKQNNVVRRPRETDVRATCDTCMTSLFSSSWMCRQCGREACEYCYKTIRELTAEPNQRESIVRRERHSQANPFFLSCTRRTEHTVITFNPVSRFMQQELDESVKEMEQLLETVTKEVKADERNDAKEGVPVRREYPMGGLGAEDVRSKNEISGANQEQNAVAGGTEYRPDVGKSASAERVSNGAIVDTNSSVDQLHSQSPPSAPQVNNAQRAPPTSANFGDETNGPSSERYSYDDGICSLVVNSIPPSSISSSSASSSSLPPTSPTPLPIPTLPVPYYTGETLTEDVFARLWAKGVPLVVTGLLERFQIQWTPEYFKQTYGTQGCIILECQLDTNKRVNVYEFFGSFGKYEGRTECWKLKDWPPSTDFKSAFPELYEDFSRAVPVPSYTRRDGAMNIASHFPSNTISPDLGPKMYNAFASKDEPGSKGSTRLHMDMADAVNIMQYAEKTPDGAPGSAAWDIFRSEDSSKIRQFLKKHFKNKYQNDPIHAQSFYLDVELRKKLYEEYGVKSFRIYQRPGEAVFIPAGCAHQVLNLADCIKVACDFVSPENIERCEKLTEEFRDQNQSMVWKEDVLQLRTMMWYAWLSCRRQVQANRERWGGGTAGVPVSPSASAGGDGREKERNEDSSMDVDGANDGRSSTGEETPSTQNRPNEKRDGQPSSVSATNGDVHGEGRGGERMGVKPPDIRPGSNSNRSAEFSSRVMANGNEETRKNALSP